MHYPIKRILSVALSILLVTSLVTMAGAGSAFAAPPENPDASSRQQDRGVNSTSNDSPPGHTRGDAANVSIPEVSGNSTVDLLVDVQHQLENLSIDESEDQAIRNGTIESVNESIDTYRADIFATSPRTFDHQAEAQRGIGRLIEGNATNTTKLRAVRAELSTATNITARLATRQSYEAVQSYEGEFDNRGQRQKAESHLANSAAALERGDNSSDANATSHYRSAWKHAEKALDVIEANTQPNLTLSRGPAIDRNGTVTVSVSIRLTDVRPYTYDSATVVVDDGNPRKVNLTADLLAGGSARGAVSVDVGPDLENRTVRVSVAPENESNRSVQRSLSISVEESEVRKPLPSSDEYTEVTIRNETSGVTVEAAGNGLHQSQFTIRNVTPDESNNLRAGPVVRIENRSAFDEARVTLPLDSQNTSLDNLTIYKWDPAGSSGVRPLETDIDQANGTASATVDSFSYYTVMSESAWRAYLTETISLEERHFENGASDSTESGGTETNSSDTGGSWDDGDFESGWYVEEAGSWDVTDGTATWTGGFDSKDYRTDEVSLDPETSIDLSFEAYLSGTWAYYFRVRLLNQSGDVLLGGEIGHDEYNDRGGLVGYRSGTFEGKIRWTHQTLSANEWITVELQYRPERAECRIVAEGPTTAVNRTVDPETCAGSIDGQTIESVQIGGWSHSNGDKIRNITVQTDREIGSGDRELLDSNGDGIPDAVAEANPRVPQSALAKLFGENGSDRIDIDPFLLDSSGDGLLDNETIDVEYEVFQDGNETKLRTWVSDARSHPARFDTDGDGLSDYEEVEVWKTNAFVADTSGDGLNDLVDPAPNERTLPPEFKYQSYNINDYSPIPAPVITVRDNLLVVARPTGAATGISEIRIHQYVDTWVPYVENGWRNETYEGEPLDDSDGVQVKVPFGDAAGQIAPDQVAITVVDSDGNAVGVSHNVDSGLADLSAGVTPTEAMALLTVGAVANAGAISTAEVFSSTFASAEIAVGGTVAISATGAAIAIGGYVLFVAETSGTASGTVMEETAIQPIPVTESRGRWEHGDIEITLPSGASYEHEHLDRERRHGWEQVKRLPGIEQPEDVGQIIDNGEQFPNSGKYDIIIGDNLFGSGQIILRLLDGMVISAGHIVEDPTGQNVEIDRTDRHPVGREGHPENWDVIEDAVRNPNEIWENVVPHGTERHYIRKIGDAWVIVRVYFEGTRWTVSTASIVPTRDKVEKYIRERDLDKKVYG